MKKFMTEFKEFIARGNAMQMAIGIIIGSAFGAIINAIVENLISPIIGMICGGIDFSTVGIHVGTAFLGIGNIINAIITFVLTAFVLFLIIKAMNARSKKEEEAPAPEPEPTAEEKLLTEIRDLLKNK